MSLLRHILDARLLEPPEPLQRATALLGNMQAGECLLMQHRRIPWPLFEFCDKQSLRHVVREIAPQQEYLIVIYYPVDESTLREEGLL